MTDHEAIRRFVYAGHATFSLRGQSRHYTFRVELSQRGAYFVKLLTAPDTYTYMGMIRLDTYTCTATKASSYNADSPPLRAFNWFLKRLHYSDSFPGMEFWHEGKCCRCGRPLTDPESIERGIGPVCMGIAA